MERKVKRKGKEIEALRGEVKPPVWKMIQKQIEELKLDECEEDYQWWDQYYRDRNLSLSEGTSKNFSSKVSITEHPKEK